MKKNVVILFGGKSVEHDISIITAKQVFKAIDKDLYNVYPIYSTHENKWKFLGENFNIDDKKNKEVFLKTGENILYFQNKLGFIKKLFKIDCAILCFHGMNGEDGTIQGLLELCNIPYTSSNVLASAISMDKIFMKKLFESFNFKVVDFVNFNKNDYLINKDKIINIIEEKLGYPVIIKPSNLGSSIGINKCLCKTELENSIEIALNYDNNILVETAIENFKEINCACLGNYENVIVSSLEEPVNWKDFLTFEDKYKNNSKKIEKRVYPAKISEKITKQIQKTSLEIFKAFNLSGVVRIDYILKDSEVYVNEINSIPGSLAFYLFEKQNLTFNDVLNKLIELAFKKFEDKQKLNFVYNSNLKVV